MTAKLTFAFVKSKFEEKGYQLLEKEYINANTKMKYICLKHLGKGVQHIRYGSLYDGGGCKYCGAENTAKKLKLDIKFVTSEFNKRNYELLENTYINSQTKMKYKCLDHPFNTQAITYNNFSQGKGCVYCVGRRRLNINIIKDEFKERNYELLDTEYKNSKTKLRYICKLHPNQIQSMRYNNFHSGDGCKYCAIETNKEKLKLDINYIEGQLKAHGFILITKNYINAREKIEYICEKHPFETQYALFHSIINGHGCRFCGSEKFSEKTKRENHWNWKGGKTDLTLYLRMQINQWRIDTFKKYGFKCILTGEKAEVVHHLYPFYKIFEEILKETNIQLYENINDYNDEQLEILKNKCLDLHYKYGLGAPLTKEVHFLFHSTYGTKDFTLQDFEEFKDKFIS